jgi:hypothetical protein
MQILRITVCCLLLWGVAKAQVSNSPALSPSDASVDVLDSLLEVFYDSNPAWAFSQQDYDMYGFAAADTPRFTPEVFADRISKINSPIEYTYNKQVQAFIDLYTLKRRTQVSNMLALTEEACLWSSNTCP